MNSKEAGSGIQGRRAFYRASQIAAGMTFPISIPSLTFFARMTYESFVIHDAANLPVFGLYATASLAAVALATTGIYLAGRERRILKNEMNQQTILEPIEVSESVEEPITAAAYRLPVLSGALFYEAPAPPFQYDFGAATLPELPKLFPEASDLSAPIPMLPDFSGGLPDLQRAPEMPDISLGATPTQSSRRGLGERGQSL